MPETLQHHLLVIEDSVLQGMLGNEAILRALPFLAQLRNAPRKTGCGHCGGGAAQRARSGAYQQAKQAIAALGSDKKAELKRLLNTRQLRVLFRAQDGRVISLTF